MNYLKTYEELSLFGLFDSPEKKKLTSIFKEIDFNNWKKSNLNGHVILNKKKITNNKIESIQIKISLKSNIITLNVAIKPVFPRTKSCKELFNILRSRALQFDFGGELFHVTYDLTLDYVFFILKKMEIDNDISKKVERYLNHDFEGLYEHMLEEYVSNENDSKQNQKDMQQFFNSKLNLINDFERLTKVADKYKVESSRFYKLASKINLLNPKFIFKFEFMDSNLMRKSVKHLIITEKLVKIFELLDKGMRRARKVYPSTNFEIYLNDKTVFLNIRNSEENILKVWEQEQELIYDFFIDLEDISQNANIINLKKWSSKENKVLFDGYRFQFNFQSIIAEIEESYRLINSILICKGLINDRFLKSMRLAIELANKSKLNKHNLDYKISVGDKSIIVYINLDIKGTWQETTRKEQSEEEMDFDDIEDD